VLPLSLLSSAPRGWGGGAYSTKFYREALPQGSTPYPFAYHFDRKGTPLPYLKLKKGILSRTFITGL